MKIDGEKELLELFDDEEKLRKLFDTHVEAMQKDYETVETDDDEPMPVLLVHGLNMDTRQLETTMIGLADFGDDRFEMLNSIGKLYRAENSDCLPLCITFSSEGWMAKAENEEEADKIMEMTQKLGGVSKLPKKYKQEVAIVTMLTHDRQSGVVSFDIKRDAKGKRKPIKMKIYKPVLDNLSESPLLNQFFYGFAEQMVEERKKND